MSSKHSFSIGLSLIGIFIGIFFYIFRQNFANAQKTFQPQQNINSTQDLNSKQDLDSTESSDFLDSNILNIVDQSKQKYKTTFDLETDSSFQRYLDDKNPFKDSNYKPLDLEPINSFFTANKSKNFQLRTSAGIAFADMARAFWDYFDKTKKINLVSAYRSYSFQSSLIKNGCSNNKCADPGSSEHQAGLAVDISVVNNNGSQIKMLTGTEYYHWMKDNAYKYGFHNTYQKGVDVDGKIPEYRHRRYLGIPLATYLYNNNLTLGEYYKLIKNGDSNIYTDPLWKS